MRPLLFLGGSALSLVFAASLLLGCPSAPPEDYCGIDMVTPPLLTVVGTDGGTICEPTAVVFELPDGAVVQQQAADAGVWVCTPGFGTVCPTDTRCAYQLPVVMDDQGEPARYTAQISKTGYVPSLVSVHGGVASCVPPNDKPPSSVTAILAPLPTPTAPPGT